MARTTLLAIDALPPVVVVVVVPLVVVVVVDEVVGKTVSAVDDVECDGTGNGRVDALRFSVVVVVAIVWQ
jgi:hypothetical protein